jgi:hypothetical protein
MCIAALTIASSASAQVGDPLVAEERAWFTRGLVIDLSAVALGAGEATFAFAGEQKLGFLIPGFLSFSFGGLGVFSNSLFQASNAEYARADFLYELRENVRFYRVFSISALAFNGALMGLSGFVYRSADEPRKGYFRDVFVGSAVGTILPLASWLSTQFFLTAIETRIHLLRFTQPPKGQPHAFIIGPITIGGRF